MKHKCPCCGYFTFEKKVGGTHDICPVCYWEDCLKQLKDHDLISGWNPVSLHQARENFISIGACEPEMLEHVRPPNDDELLGLG